MEKYIQTSVVFQTYSVVLNLMNKSLLLLAERGADHETLNFMVQTINLLIQRINDYAGDLAMEKNWNNDLDEICDRFNIERATPEKGRGGETPPLE